MALTHRHRKLTKSPTNDTTRFPTCLIQRDSQLSLTGLCSENCTIYSPSSFRTVESSPSPSPATSPYTQQTGQDNHQSPLVPLKIFLVFMISTFIYTSYKAHLRKRRLQPRRHRTLPPSLPENQETRDHGQNDVMDHPIWFIRTTGLQPSVINEITVLKYNKTDGVVEGCDCSVCLNEFEAGDMVRLLPNCKHAFHISCIDTWLRSHTNCPLCRAAVVDNNVVNVTNPERNNHDSGLIGETDLEALMINETGESSELRIGERDEEDQIGNNDRLSAFDHNGNRVRPGDRNSGIELVKLG